MLLTESTKEPAVQMFGTGTLEVETEGESLV